MDAQPQATQLAPGPSKVLPRASSVLGLVTLQLREIFTMMKLRVEVLWLETYLGVRQHKQ